MGYNESFQKWYFPECYKNPEGLYPDLFTAGYPKEKTKQAGAEVEGNIAFLRLGIFRGRKSNLDVMQGEISVAIFLKKVLFVTQRNDV